MGNAKVLRCTRPETLGQASHIAFAPSTKSIFRKTSDRFELGSQKMAPVNGTKDTKDKGGAANLYKAYAQDAKAHGRAASVEHEEDESPLITSSEVNKKKGSKRGPPQAPQNLD